MDFRGTAMVRTKCGGFCLVFGAKEWDQFRVRSKQSQYAISQA